MNKKNILIYSLNSSPETTGVGRYVGQMVDFLTSTEEFEVTVISATPYYPQWQSYTGFKNTFSKSKSRNLTEIRCPIYIPKKPGVLKRLLHLFSFTLSSIPALLYISKTRFSYITVIAPTLAIAPNALVFGKLKGSKTQLHIQDFEVDAMLGINMDGNPSVMHSLGLQCERFLLKRFDSVSSISNRMVSKLWEKGVSAEKTFYFPNWVNTDNFQPMKNKSICRGETGIDFDGKIVLYSGNIGKKQGLDLVINVADKLKENSNILFLISGDGSEKSNLIAMAEKKNLENVRFMDFVSEQALPALLNAADVHLVLQKTGVGDSVMPSKLTNIIAVGGHAIVSAEEDTEIYDLHLENPGIYTLIPTDDEAALLTAITSKCGLEKIEPNRLGKRYAEKNLNQDVILNKYKDNLEKLVV